MPGKMRECDGCHKIMRSDNLKNHMRKCNGLNERKFLSKENIQEVNTDRSSNIFPPPVKPPNPKISALVDAIIDEEEPRTPSVIAEKIPEKKVKDLPDIEFEEESSGESCDEDTNGSMDEYESDGSMDNE